MKGAGGNLGPFLIGGGMQDDSTRLGIDDEFGHGDSSSLGVSDGDLCLAIITICLARVVGDILDWMML